MTINTRSVLLLLLAQSAAPPKFEVASVKPGAECADAGRGGGRPAAPSSPGRLDLKCQTVMSLVRMAYVGAARNSTQISGGPAWITTERFDIDAKAEGAPGQETMRGPMLQALLEDRFQLQVHRETKDVPVYLLSAAKGGPKRLKPAEEGKCFTRVPNDPQAPRPPAGMPICSFFYPAANKDGTDIFGITMPDLARQLTALSDREVVDKTGIAGKFDIHLDPPDTEPLEPHTLVDVVVAQLNMRLDSAKAPGEFLIIDRVERLSGN